MTDADRTIPSSLPDPARAPEVIRVDADEERVACDGGGGALGHPMVWYSFGTGNRVVCGYCDREFVRDED